MIFKILIIYMICASFVLFESKANEIENTSNQGKNFIFLFYSQIVSKSYPKVSRS